MMSKDESKIEIASADEVAQYAAKPEDHSQADAGAEDAQSPDDESAGLDDKLAEAQDKFLRAKAEAQNIARRAEQQRLDAVRYGNAELLRSLLVVVDDFERTLEAAADTDTVKPVLEGIKLVYDKLMKLLSDNSVEVIDARGKPFNPAEHAAMLQQPSDEHEAGTVIQEVVRGYRYRERILRPTQVIVAQAPESAADESAED
ncbi:MAG: nucleotide exchange factor GrpE [bacterium]|nr:nucleotide exchange factor GrpE [bacterium]